MTYFNRLLQKNQVIKNIVMRPEIEEWEESTGENPSHPENWPTVLDTFPVARARYYLGMTEEWTIIASLGVWSPSDTLLKEINNSYCNGQLSKMVHNLYICIDQAVAEEWGPGSYDPPFLNIYNGRVSDEAKINLSIQENSGYINAICTSEKYKLELSNDGVILTVKGHSYHY
jgi:hypothetical protein